MRAVLPAGPGWFVIQEWEDGDEWGFNKIPVLGWVVHVEDGPSYVRQGKMDPFPRSHACPVTAMDGSEESVVLGPDGAVYAPYVQLWQSIEAWATSRREDFRRRRAGHS